MSDYWQKVAESMHGHRPGRTSASPEEGLEPLDNESLGPSGESNRDFPDYNFVAHPSPLNVATALESDKAAIPPETEAYMRNLGMWDAKTDSLLRSRGLRNDDYWTKAAEGMGAVPRAEGGPIVAGGQPNALDQALLAQFGAPPVPKPSGPVPDNAFLDAPPGTITIGDQPAGKPGFMRPVPPPSPATAAPGAPEAMPVSGPPSNVPPVSMPGAGGPPPRDGGAGHGDFPLMAVPGGGVIPAHEVEMRGPQLKAAQGKLNETAGAAVGSMEGRSLDAAAQEYNTYLGHERSARIREDAAMASMAERDAELQARQADFDQSVKALSKMQMDPNRFWASRSTGQKISGLIGIALGGFVQGARGGPNAGLDIINSHIERDLKAQEFGFHAAAQTAQAKQTAFSMAMNKYQNLDAARAMARAAALDGMQAQIAQQGAIWKGTEAANHADAMIVSLEQQKMQQIQQGVAFVQAQSSGRRFVDPRTGLVYSEQEAKALDKELRGQEHDLAKGAQGVAGQVIVEGAKAQAQRATKGSDEARAISNQLQQAGVPQARVAAERALAAMNASAGGRGEAAARAVLDSPFVPGIDSNAVMGEKANAREQAYAEFSSAAIKAVMGNATKDEVARAEKYLGSLKTPEARKRAIDSAMQQLDAIEHNAKGGATFGGQEQFDTQRDGATAGKALVPKGSVTGWGK